MYWSISTILEISISFLPGILIWEITTNGRKYRIWSIIISFNKIDNNLTKYNTFLLTPEETIVAITLFL